MPIRFRPRHWPALGVIAAAIAPAPPAKAESLNLLIWESYISDEVVARWKARTGVEVNQIYFDSGDKRDEIISRPESDIDLVLVNDKGARRFGKRGLLEPLDDADVPALGNVAPRWRETCGAHAAAYFWGTVGIAYRSDRISVSPMSWLDLLEPAPGVRGRIAMLADPDDLLIPPLIVSGKSVNTSDVADLKAAFTLLKAQAPSVLTYDYVITAVQDPRYRDRIDMALAYSGDQHTLNDGSGDGHPWRYVVPEEGSLLWVDCLAAMARSPRLATALRFIDFLNEPEHAAQNALSLNMPSPNVAAVALLPEAMRNDRQIFPPEDVLANSQLVEDLALDVAQTRRRIVSALANFHESQ